MGGKKRAAAELWLSPSGATTGVDDLDADAPRGRGGAPASVD